MIARLPCLSGDTRGVSAVEFALIAPVLLILIFGGLQLAFDVWAQAMLNGAVQLAGRNSGLESAHGSQTSIDDYVAEQIHAYLPGAQLTFSRRNYESFSDVGRPEDFTDSNKNGVYDSNECFVDENGNGRWDSDVGATGQGGARDVVVYTVTMAYEELVPISRFIGMKSAHNYAATTTLMNQPFSTQADRTERQICP